MGANKKDVEASPRQWQCLWSFCPPPLGKPALALCWPPSASESINMQIFRGRIVRPVSSHLRGSSHKPAPCWARGSWRRHSWSLAWCPPKKEIQRKVKKRKKNCACPPLATSRHYWWPRPRRPPLSRSCSCALPPSGIEPSSVEQHWHQLILVSSSKTYLCHEKVFGSIQVGQRDKLWMVGSELQNLSLNKHFLKY